MSINMTISIIKLSASVHLLKLMYFLEPYKIYDSKKYLSSGRNLG